MPAKKNSRPRDNAKDTAAPPQPAGRPLRNEKDRGFSGQGSGSALAQLLEQERVRTRKPEPESD
jgi:hypothetical protein